MTTVPLNEAKERLAELATLVEKGETVTVTHNGKPLFDIVPPKMTERGAEKVKKGGLDLEAGAKFLRERGIDKVFTYVAPDFDDPLPEDFLITPLPK
jgi:prevent-host-death family protein